MRQLWDVKGQGDPLKMDLDNLTHYGALCAWALARAHARTGDPVAADRLPGRVDALRPGHRRRSPAAYARTNERDHAALLEAIADGRIVAETGI